MNVQADERLPGLLAHELRNPLASAVTAVLVARDLVDAEDPRAAVLDGALRDLDRLAELIDGWLRLAQNRRPTRRTVDVEQMLRTVATRHGAELVCCPTGTCVQGNEALLERAFDNLCENARKAGAHHIRIAVQGLDDQLNIHVEDDGSGVAPMDAQRVFTPGWSTGGGAGLGLHAVAATVAAHHGSIRCVPIARGTRFTMTLPATASYAATA